MGTIKTKRVYDRADPGDGRRILVDRLWPRGLKKEAACVDMWLKEIAPSHELRRWFGHDRSKWEEFRKRYLEELGQKQPLVESLVAEAQRGDVTLLFAAQDETHNNAVVLAELVNRLR